MSAAFGSSVTISTRVDRSNDRQIASERLWKRLNDHNGQGSGSGGASGQELLSSLPSSYYPDQFMHPHQHTPNSSRGVDKTIIKLEIVFGPERQYVIVKRTRDLIVRDVMEEVERDFGVPVGQQVLIYRGKHISDYPMQTLDSFAIVSNHTIRVTRDTEPLSHRSHTMQEHAAAIAANVEYQQQAVSKSIGNFANAAMETVKVYVSFGSEREYILVNGVKPLRLADLKHELSYCFNLPVQQQCIVYKGYNMHEYVDDTPLESFGIENNSRLSLWHKSHSEMAQAAANAANAAANAMSTNAGHSDILHHEQFVGPPIRIPVEVLKLEVQQGSDRHTVVLKGSRQTLTVMDLQAELERLTRVPAAEQRLFFKSQQLHMQPLKLLKDFELENNHVIKLTHANRY